MANDAIEVQGIVTEVKGYGKYTVFVEDMDMEFEGHLSGKMKKFRIKIIPGDLVTMELNPYEPTKGRITFRRTNQVDKRKPKDDNIVPLNNTGNSSAAAA